jgi:hypothetical protein
MRPGCPVMFALGLSLVAGTAVVPIRALAAKRVKVLKVKDPTKPYAYTIDLKLGPFAVNAKKDRYACQFVELPYDQLPTVCLRGEAPGEPPQCGLPFIGFDVRLELGASHHMILWTYEGTTDGAARFPRQIYDNPTCIADAGKDVLQLRQVILSQYRRLTGILPDGLGQLVKAIDAPDGTHRSIGLILNAHYAATGKRSRGLMKVRLLVPRAGQVRRYGTLMFGATGNLDINVPPGQTGSTTGTWGVGQTDLPFVNSPPAHDSCLILLASHAHKRLLDFVADLVRPDGTERVYESTNWAEPVLRWLIPPRFITAVDELRYTCTYDNGVQRPVKMGCEVTPGTPPGVPLSVTFPDGERGDGAPVECTSDADCAGIGTGRCVPANLVFGWSSDDEMCNLGGMFYRANIEAPPGSECDLSLVPPL